MIAAPEVKGLKRAKEKTLINISENSNVSSSDPGNLSVFLKSFFLLIIYQKSQILDRPCLYL